MKYMVLLLAVLAGVWLVKRQQARKLHAAQSRRRPQVTHATPMLACRHCGVHVPQHEAVQGRLGAYCSRAHQQASEPSRS